MFEESMYKNMFDDTLQKEMEQFFLEKLAPLGRIEQYQKNEIIDPKTANDVFIVLEGRLNQVLYSSEGDEITFYRLDRGTIFGEMDFFDRARTYILTKTISHCKVSRVNRLAIEPLLHSNPKLYHHFLHSVIRKFRIIMLEMADIKFNDSLGKIANALLRWHYITKYRNEEMTYDSIDSIFTHEEMATRLVSNRSTITHGLNFFKEEGIISVDNRRIKILNIEKLKEFSKNVV